MMTTLETQVSLTYSVGRKLFLRLDQRCLATMGLGFEPTPLCVGVECKDSFAIATPSNCVHFCFPFVAGRAVVYNQLPN